MDVVLDANILFAALIRDNKSRSLLVSEKLTLYAPEFILEELEQHKGEILQKTLKPVEEFELVLAMFRRRIILMPLAGFVLFLDNAEEIAPDMKDVAYIALALKLKIPIWSNDKALREKQAKVTVYTTEEIINIIERP